MRKNIYLISTLTFLLVASLVVAHEDSSFQVRTRPDSPFYGLSVTFDKLLLLLTFDQTAKAHKALELAEERLAEINLMLEENNMRATERARLEYEWALEKTKTAIRSIEERNTTEQITKVIELQKKIEEHEEKVETVRAKVKTRIEGKLTEEDRARINSMLENIGNFTGKVKIEAINKINNTKVKVKIESGITNEEVEKKIKEIENRTGLTKVLQQKAEDALRDAREKIAELEKEPLSVDDTKVRNSVLVLLNQAKEHLALAETAFDEGKFGEAYGHATAAEQQAENVHKQLERLTKVGEEYQRTEIDEERVCIQLITYARNKNTGECREFPTPCDVPRGWEKVDKCPEKMRGCIDLCGDGVCQEVVCMAIGCPCPETKETCPTDCK